MASQDNNFEERSYGNTHDVEPGEIRDDGLNSNEVNSDGSKSGGNRENLGERLTNGGSAVRNVNSMTRKKYRRKSLFKSRGESGGSCERPKKRLRDENDIFGLDKLIGIMSSNSD
ncbi:hypothetical protein Hanom_Chr08g00700931 [Helianthus anomalus]